VKFNSKQLKKITKNLEKRFDEFTEDKEELNKAGEIILKEIKANSRQGIGFDGKALPIISSSWQESRFYSPSSLNSTVSFTGDTIDKTKYKLEGKKIVIFGDGNHKKLRGTRGQFLKGSNAPIGEILAGLKDLGYKILGVSEKARDQIRTNFIRFIRRKLR
jgi:hypothetical protein